MITISKKEWRFVAVVGLITMVVTFVPIIIGWLNTPPGSIFLWRSYSNGVDFPFYFHTLRQIEHGHLLTQNLFTSEANQIPLLNPFWLAVGLFAAFLHLSPEVAFHVSRFILAPLLLVLAYYVVAFFFEESWKRKVVFVLLVFSSGVFMLAGNADASIIFSIYSMPHFVASFILIILISLFSILAFENNTSKYSLWAGLCALVLFSFHPYHVPTIFGVLGVFVVVWALKEKRLPINYLKHCAIIGLFSLPPLAYYLWQFMYSDVFYQWSLQNVTPSPSLWLMLANYNFLLPFLLIGIWVVLARRPLALRQVFLVVWAVTQFVLVYLPIKTQGRLTEALSVPIILLAAYGLFYSIEKIHLDRWLKHYELAWLIAPLCLVPSLFFSLTIIAADVQLYLSRDSNMYIPKSQVQAMSWLAANTAQDSVVFSTPESGSVMPEFSLRREFIGHHHGTTHFAEKLATEEQFAKEQDAQKQLAFLKENNIDYIYYGPFEQKNWTFNPDADAFLQKVYHNETVSIYRVQ